MCMSSDAIVEKGEAQELPRQAPSESAARYTMEAMEQRLHAEQAAKAHLEHLLRQSETKNRDQAIQLQKLHEIQQLAQPLGRNNVSNNNNESGGTVAPAACQSQWELYTKLEHSMKTNQTMVAEMAKLADERLRLQQTLNDKQNECTCLVEQLEDLATQLTLGEQDMAEYIKEMKLVKHQHQSALDRIILLEQALHEQDRDMVENGTNIDTPQSVLYQRLKDAEERLQQAQKERDASVAKATKASLQLAMSKEQSDLLQEKLNYQNTIIQTVVGKRSKPRLSLPSINEKLTSLLRSDSSDDNYQQQEDIRASPHRTCFGQVAHPSLENARSSIRNLISWRGSNSSVRSCDSHTKTTIQELAITQDESTSTRSNCASSDSTPHPACVSR